MDAAKNIWLCLACGAGMRYDPTGQPHATTLQARGPPDPADRPASRPSFRFVSRGTPSQRQMLGKAPVLTPEPWHIRQDGLPELHGWVTT